MNWPIHFDTAINQLNNRILPAYKFSPNELCLGTVVNTNPTPVEISSSELTESAIGIKNQYKEQQGLDAYSHIVEHANKRKATFNKKVLASRDRVIKYRKGDLVQVQDSNLDLTLTTEVKLLPHWGPPHHITNCIHNSYWLETIQGLPIRGTVSMRQLR